MAVDPAVEPMRSGGVLSLPSGVADTVMGLTPAAAIGLYYLAEPLVPGWWWIVFIPLMAVLLYGPQG